jgi:hypothetical protein
MSEAQQATPEQQARMEMEAAIQEAQQRAMQDVQQNAQIEIQMRGNSLNLAVQANEPGTDPVTIAKTAEAFLKFLKTGEAVQKEQ